MEHEINEKGMFSWNLDNNKGKLYKVMLPGSCINPNSREKDYHRSIELIGTGLFKKL